MPYNLFLTMRRSNEISKAKAVFMAQGGYSEPVITVEEPEFLEPGEVLQLLLKAIQAHMAVRRDVQRGA